MPCGDDTATVLGEELVIETVEQEDFAIEAKEILSRALNTALPVIWLWKVLPERWLIRSRQCVKKLTLMSRIGYARCFGLIARLRRPRELHKGYVTAETLSKELVYGGDTELAKALGEHTRKWINGHVAVISVGRKEE